MYIGLKPLAAAAVLVLGAVSAQAQDLKPFSVQLKWVPQAQFAGYYVAKEKGFYKDVGLDVDVKPGGPDINPSQVIAGGGADVVVDWMPSALATREKGVPLVNVAQFFNRSGMMLTCRKDTGITSPTDFKGKTLGVWFAGNEYPFLSWMAKLGYSTNGPNADVTVLRQGFNVDPLLQNQAACISTMTYNEYWQLIDAGLKPEELITFSYEDQGVATLEDGLYALESNLKDPEYLDRLARFIAGTIRGWQYAVEHPQEAAQIVVDADPSGAATLEVQTRQMGEIAKLLPKEKIGWLDPAAYQRTVQVLLSGQSDPVITKDPGDAAWTHAAYDKAQQYLKG